MIPEGHGFVQLYREPMVSHMDQVQTDVHNASNNL